MWHLAQKVRAILRQAGFRYKSVAQLRSISCLAAVADPVAAGNDELCLRDLGSNQCCSFDELWKAAIRLKTAGCKCDNRIAGGQKPAVWQTKTRNTVGARSRSVYALVLNNDL